MNYKDYSYLFIVTYGRSGSTLMQSLLNSLDSVQIRGENYNALFHLHQTIRDVSKTKKLSRKRRISNPDEPWYGAGALQPLLYRNTLLNAFVSHVLRPEEGKTVLGFKEIRHSPKIMTDFQFTAYMDFLLETFPGAKIVFNTRNAEDVAKSGWFAQQDPEKTTATIRACDARFARYDASSDQTILMHYDDYVTDRSKIAELFAFLGYDYDAEVVAAIFSKPLEHAKEPPGPINPSPS
ncbi:sulfotransferase [Ruegeria hyattellae]|uniref:sulfotransferase n=1 Tax=Ruegeria hyattellae TaxID=3233337 RepID=UPI00355B156B